MIAPSRTIAAAAGRRKPTWPPTPDPSAQDKRSQADTEIRNYGELSRAGEPELGNNEEPAKQSPDDRADGIPRINNRRRAADVSDVPGV